MADDPYFASRFTPDPARGRVWGAICRYLQRSGPEAGAVLDLGAGYCSFVNRIRAATRHALDASPELPRHAGAGVRPHVGRCEDLSAFANGSLDAVFASNLPEKRNPAARDFVTQGIAGGLLPWRTWSAISCTVRACWRGGPASRPSRSRPSPWASA